VGKRFPIPSLSEYGKKEKEDLGFQKRKPMTRAICFMKGGEKKRDILLFDSHSEHQGGGGGEKGKKGGRHIPLLVEEGKRKPGSGS